MTTTPDLGIPELAQAQANPDVTHNEALVLIQAMLNGVVDKDLTSPPGSPSEGDAYLINTASPTGAWANRAYCVAIYWGGSWRFLPGNDDAGSPIAMGSRQEGLRVWVRDENQVYVWRNTATSPLSYDWVAEGVGPFLPLSGGTLTGQLTVNYGDPLGIVGGVVIQAPSGTSSILDIIAEGTVGCINRTSIYRGSSTEPNYQTQKARGTVASPAVIVTADRVGSFRTSGYGGTSFVQTSLQRIDVHEPTPSQTAMGSRETLFLNVLGAATLTEITRFEHATGFSMFGANPVIDQNRLFRRRVYTFATLPAAGTAGRYAQISDGAAAPVWGAAAAGGGAVQTPVFDNGAAWING